MDAVERAFNLQFFLNFSYFLADLNGIDTLTKHRWQKFDGSLDDILQNIKKSMDFDCPPPLNVSRECDVVLKTWEKQNDRVRKSIRNEREQDFRRFVDELPIIGVEVADPFVPVDEAQYQLNAAGGIHMERVGMLSISSIRPPRRHHGLDLDTVNLDRLVSFIIILFQHLDFRLMEIIDLLH